MNNLINALEGAVTTKRISSRLLFPTANIRCVCDTLGMSPQTTVRNLITVLGLPGNFMPGQHLSTGKERDIFEGSHQADLMCVGLDTSVWKFWTADESPWGSGVVKPAGGIAAGAPLAVQSTDIDVNGEHYVLGVCAASIESLHVNAMWQDPDGNWSVALPAAGGNTLPKRAHVAPYFGEIGSFVAVDVTGTLQLYRNDSDSLDMGATWTTTPISEQSFAPPGAPVAVDTRLQTGGDPNGPVNVFVVDNYGAMWVFESNDDGATWSAARMPNPNNISFPPGAQVTTGYQAGVRQSTFGRNDDLGYCQLDVFAIDLNGEMHMWWESQGSPWTASGVPEFGSFPPGAPIATGFQVFELLYGRDPYGAQLDFFAVDTSGIIRRAWNYKSGNWSFDTLPSSIALPPGAYLATAYQSIDDQGSPHQLDVFAVGVDGRIAVYWQNESPWNCETMPGSDAPVPGQFM